MSDYTSTFTEGTGDTIDVTDFSTEFNAIETAISTKADKTGTIDRADAVVEQDSSTRMNMKVLDIGDWDMDADVNASVAHGVTQSKIRTVQAFIINDASTTLYDLNVAGYVNINGANIVLNRHTGEFFDGIGYDSTSFNRGYITLWYTD